MGGFKALTKSHFKEGIDAGVEFAKTQGGHGSQKRTGEIMKEIVSYGTAARGAVPGLRELIVSLNEQCERGEFPKGELNNQRISDVEDAIKDIEVATTQPERLAAKEISFRDRPGTWFRRQSLQFHEGLFFALYTFSRPPRALIRAQKAKSVSWCESPTLTPLHAAFVRKFGRSEV